MDTGILSRLRTMPSWTVLLMVAGYVASIPLLLYGLWLPLLVLFVVIVVISGRGA